MPNYLVKLMCSHVIHSGIKTFGRYPPGAAWCDKCNEYREVVEVKGANNA